MKRRVKKIGSDRQVLTKLIEHGKIFMDVTFPKYPVPLSNLEVEIKEMLEIDIKVRPANTNDVERIIEFFDVSKLITECKAKW